MTKEIEGTLALPFAPISSALAGTPERPDWVWDGYVAPRAVTLLAGRPKVGKSTLLFAFAAAVTRGHLPLDSPTRSARILLLSEERGDTLREKRERWGLNDHVHLLMRHQAPGSKWPEIVEQAVAHCSEHHLDVLAVDTWDKWAGLGGDSENSSGAVLEALKPLADAAGGGLAVIISAHQRKSHGEYGEAVRGSNALTGAVDVIVEIERAKLAEGGTARVLRTVSRFDQAPPDELVVILDEQGYQARGNLADMRADEERGAVLRAAADAADGLTADDAAKVADIPRATAHKRLGELVEAGDLRREGAGRRGSPYRWFLSSQVPSLSDETSTAGVA